MGKLIKNIIFDFGGILLDLDYSLSFNRLKELLNIEGDIPENVQLILDEYEMDISVKARFSIGYRGSLTILLQSGLLWMHGMLCYSTFNSTNWILSKI